MSAAAALLLWESETSTSKPVFSAVDQQRLTALSNSLKHGLETLEAFEKAAMEITVSSVVAVPAFSVDERDAIDLEHVPPTQQPMVSSIFFASLIFELSIFVCSPDG